VGSLPFGFSSALVKASKILLIFPLLSYRDSEIPSQLRFYSVNRPQRTINAGKTVIKKYAAEWTLLVFSEALLLS
jgi:hypothetical protein